MSKALFRIASKEIQIRLGPTPAKYLDLQILKVKTLQLIARFTGLNSAGTKRAIIDTLLLGLGKDGLDISHKLQHSQLTQNFQHDNTGEASLCPQRVLSIDMGVQNLAYCELEVIPAKAISTRTALRDLQPWLKVRDWKRLPMEEIPQLTLLQNEDVAQDAGLAANFVRSDDTDLSSLKSQVSWHSSSMATRAFHLLHHLVFSKPVGERPDAILIERQRWRTGGASAVQEWTVRVNTFEAMLWATATTARMQGLWSGQLHGIDPAKVSSWWLEKLAPDESLEEAPKKVKQIEGKKMKVQIVRDWLARGDMVSEVGSSESAKWVWQAFAKKLVQGRRKAEDVASGSSKKQNKLDDVADCLLQGVAFLQWEQNKRKLIELGLGPFLKENGIIDAGIDKYE